MKILIIGEFSAFAKNLALGINSIPGHEAIVFGFRDGFKDIRQDGKSFEFPQEVDSCFYIKGKRIPRTTRLHAWYVNLKFRLTVLKYRKYFDAIFIINDQFIRLEENKLENSFSSKDILFVVKDESKIFMSSCGGDIVYWTYALNDKRLQKGYKDPSIIENVVRKKQHSEAEKIVRGVIPMAYEYHQAYSIYGKKFQLYDPLPLPVDSKSILQKDNYCKDGKIVIFNGALRPVKGIVYINEALTRIEKKYGDRVIIRNDRMPYQEYLSFLPQIDIYIDQCIIYDYGMSSISAMMAGCTVLSGNEPETRESFKISEIPIVSITPDSNQIFKALEELILNPDQIERIGKASAKFARDFHDARNVAKKYIDIFKN